ncbi:glutamate--cysteine ligase GCS2 [Ferroglobus placidus DSM 10642]|uniref:Glutamate--cysteine ligase GCS2 n=1 Tax=Ferroglobus placidus (strain DSM 10642 / AEDII12DO) TaxID=589924 RepID=D3S0Q9_FERPA|nr:glutamate-cysteine ligase family protein [Ferroglobus placidus]ADC66300.1 glutamate--cysteine ligase GCS2 [Ferroglobus placidus DSM 10642]
MLGPEHEFSINDENFNPLPISDQIIRKIRGRIANEAVIGRVIIGKELQKHVIELKPVKPFEELSEFEEVMQEGVEELLSVMDGCKLLGLGMHPLLKLENAKVWDHRDRKIYEAYDRIFNIKQHGWLNIQSFQLNISYSSEREAVELHNKLRILIPYIAAIASASPICEGMPYYIDTRLNFYRINQKEIPLICNDVIPEKIASLREYRKILERIYEELRKRDAHVLCREWVNSRGVIVRFSRKCLEIKVMDEQECIKSDVALTAFIRAILRAEIEELPREKLIEKLDSAIRSGTAELKSELKELFRKAKENADDEEKKYLKIVKLRIKEGSLGESILMNMGDISRKEIIGVCEELSKCLERNEVYV